MNKAVINRIKKSDKQSDFIFWQSQSYEERLKTLELIRQEYISWKYDSKQRLQRVYTIIKRK